MRNPSPIETRGNFWLPDDPDNKLPGTLSISEKGEIKVEFLGLFSEMQALFKDRLSRFEPEFDRVLGQVLDGGKVTLERCFYVHRSHSLSGGLSTSELIAETAFIGAYFENEEDMKFWEFRFSIEGLQDWLLISGIGMEQDLGNKSGSITFQLPDEITLSLPGGLELEFLFNLNFPSVSLPVTEASVTQTAFVHARPKEPQPKEFAFSTGHKICQFLSLALGQDVAYQSIEFYLERNPESTQEDFRRPIRVYAQFHPWTERVEAIRWHHSLFKFEDVEDRLEDLLTAWIKSYKTFEPVLNLYFSTAQDKSQALEVRFLQLAQGLEAIHSRKNPEKKLMPAQEYCDMRDRLLENCAPEDREWLERKLQYGNELTLRNRLNDLIKPYGHWFGNAREQNSFIGKVVEKRNYFTHYSIELDGNEGMYRDLLELYEKIEALFQLQLLELVGFDGDQIRSIVNKNGRLTRKLGSRETRPAPQENE